MTGFREFSQQKAPIDPSLLNMLAAAERMLEDPWEEEFFISVRDRIMSGYAVSDKQRNVLDKIAGGFYKQESSLRELRRGDYDPNRD